MNDRQRALDRFFSEVERRALRTAELAIGRREDALELVQEAMLKLVQHYANKRADEWPLLFQRILQSKITDWYRRQQVVNRVFSRFSYADHGDGEEASDPIQEMPDDSNNNPEIQHASEHLLSTIEQAVQALPLRQRQVFLLRAWDGLDVADTAFALGISEGSVKTHYSRAVSRLRVELEAVV